MDERYQLIESAIENKGWLRKETINFCEWWAESIWRIESRWSPEGVPAYITFLVDPQSERKVNKEVWGVGISRNSPASRTEAEKEGTLALKKIHKNLDLFTNLLEPLRSGAINDLRR